MRRVLAITVVVVGALVVALLVRGDDDPYRLQLRLANAAGLSEGASVNLGGVRIGTVDELRLGRGDAVIAELAIDADRAPIHEGVTAAISAVNLFGLKSVELRDVRRGDAVASGFVVPSSRVTTATDLDQVLAVLDVRTRARLTVLINEAGASLVGRRADLNRLLAQLPSGISDVTRLLRQLNGDNQTLERTVASSDRFIGTVTRQRRELTRAIDAVGLASETAKVRRGDLRSALRRAPATLRSLRTTLARLRATAGPRGPAAAQLRPAAPQLPPTLDELRPVQPAAAPTLRSARSAARPLLELADRGLPVIREALPVARQLETFATSMTGVTETLDKSSDNLLGVIDNWTRAIQLNDGMGHVFRAAAAVTPQTAQALVDDLLGRLSPKSRGTTPGGRRSRAAGSSGGATTAPPPAGAAAVPGADGPAPSGTTTARPAQPPVEGGLSRLLDTLLGRSTR
ncbi:MAG: MlaD family protein [Solirubrobacteraceae bacterium]